MDEQEIRLLVRQAIARHLGAAPQPATASAVVPAPTPAASGRHPAAIQFVIVRPPGETDCIIEPSVTCTHCGYCQCYGH